MNLTDFTTLVRGVHKVPVGASAVITAAEETEAIVAALREYSRKRPYTQKAYWDTNDAEEVALTAIVAGWDPELNTIAAVRIFVGTDYERTLDSREFLKSEREAGEYLRFICRVPSGYVLGLDYWAPHELDSDSCTVPDDDQSALVQLAASYVLQKAANKFSLNASSSISADAVSQSEQAKSYSFQSDDARKNYEEHIKGVQTCRSVRMGWRLEYNNGRGKMFSGRWR